MAEGSQVELVELAVVVRSHGLRGELVLKLFNPDSALLTSLERVLLKSRAGELSSLAVAVKVSNVSSSTVWSAIGSRVGDWLGATSTVTTKVVESLRFGLPSSVTTTVIAKLPGAAGVQLNAPVAGSILAPAGAPVSRLKVRPLAGRSGSVAVAMSVRGEPTVAV